MSTPITALIELADIYCAATGRTRMAVSKRVFNDGKVLDRLSAGGDLTTSRHQMALRWLSDNWPEATPWPPNIERPSQVKTATSDAAA